MFSQFKLQFRGTQAALTYSVQADHVGCPYEFASSTCKQFGCKSAAEAFDTLYHHVAFRLWDSEASL